MASLRPGSRGLCRLINGGHCPGPHPAVTRPGLPVDHPQQSHNLGTAGALGRPQSWVRSWERGGWEVATEAEAPQYPNPVILGEGAVILGYSLIPHTHSA